MINFLKPLGQTLTTTIRLIILSKWTNILQEKTDSSSKTCIIVGNGPSFNSTYKKHKTILQKNELICVNSFACTDMFEELKPSMYIINATSVFDPDEKLSEFYIQLKIDIFTALREKTTWKMIVLVPFFAQKSEEFRKLLSSNKFLIPSYYNTTPVEGFKIFKLFLFKKGLGMPRPHNVIIPALMSAIKMGYKEIYITGADHSWLKEISVNEKNDALVNHKHFYDETTSKPVKMEDYIVRPRRLHEIIYKFYLSFAGYWEIVEYSEIVGAKIYNSSETSMIDAFEREDLTEIN